MTDEQYIERLNALDNTLRRCKSDVVALLAHAIEGRQNSDNATTRRAFRRDTVKLDAIREALNKANVNMERID